MAARWQPPVVASLRSVPLLGFPAVAARLWATVEPSRPCRGRRGNAVVPGWVQGRRRGCRENRERKAVVVQQPALPLWRRVVFVDWHGVISRSPYWSTILSDRRHPLHSALRSRLGRLFSDADLLGAWMTGRLSTIDVVDRLEVTEGTRYTPEHLRRHLERDCRSMRVNTDLMTVLRVVRDRAFVVIATDNVDCFAETFRRLTTRRGGRPDPLAESPPPDSLAAWASSCDDLVCSSEVGALKADPPAFYGAYLRACGLGFADALLIDDRTDNCEAFELAGGAALRWTMHADPLAEIVHTIESWLATPAGAWSPPLRTVADVRRPNGTSVIAAAAVAGRG